MPANMMNADVGSRVNVTGSSSATAMAGPMPGSTPTKVPSSTPIAAYRRFSGVAADWSPPHSRSRLSIRSFPSQDAVEDAGRERDAQADGEAVPAADRQDGAGEDVAEHRPAAEHPGGAGE